MMNQNKPKIVGKLKISGGMFNKTHTLYEVICSRCRKPFKNLFLPIPGRPIYCGECINQTDTLTIRLDQLDKEKKKNAGNPAKLAKIDREIEKLKRLLEHK